MILTEIAPFAIFLQSWPFGYNVSRFRVKTKLRFRMLNSFILMSALAVPAVVYAQSIPDTTAPWMLLRTTTTLRELGRT